MLSKTLSKVKDSLPSGTLSAVASRVTVAAQPYDFLDGLKYNGGERLPHAPANPYRKRPLKLHYDLNEYHMFRLPSENHFLLGTFD
jgi:hypothetical protein